MNARNPRPFARFLLLALCVLFALALAASCAPQVWIPDSYHGLWW